MEIIAECSDSTGGRVACRLFFFVPRTPAQTRGTLVLRLSTGPLGMLYNCSHEVRNTALHRSLFYEAPRGHRGQRDRKTAGRKCDHCRQSPGPARPRRSARRRCRRRGRPGRPSGPRRRRPPAGERPGRGSGREPRPFAPRAGSPRAARCRRDGRRGAARRPSPPCRIRACRPAGSVPSDSRVVAPRRAERPVWRPETPLRHRSAPSTRAPTRRAGRAGSRGPAGSRDTAIPAPG